MALGINRERELFVPGCKTDEQGIIVCMPKLRKGNMTLETQTPVRLKKSDVDGRAVLEILDDGGASTELIDKLRQYVEKRHL